MSVLYIFVSSIANNSKKGFHKSWLDDPQADSMAKLPKQTHL